jgi:hypothetical protein
MTRRALCWSVVLAASFAASSLSAQVADHPVVSDSTDSVSQGGMVRLLLPALSKEWLVGKVGETLQGCTLVMVSHPFSPSGTIGVMLGSAKEAQAEFRDTDGVVKWKPVAVATAAAREKDVCDASIEG